MRSIWIMLTGVVLASVCVADPAAPYETNLLARVDNLDIQADQWALAGGVLSKNDPIYQGVKFLVVKEAVVKVPLWYSLTCDLVNPRIQSGRSPVAGLLFGFVDERNYWSLLLGQESSQPVLTLVQVKDGKTVTETRVPLMMATDQKIVRIAVNVHHGLYVKAYANKSLVLTHTMAGGIARGRVGLTLQSGLIGFSNFVISGEAKK